MISRETVRRKLETATSLGDLVTTMKGLASVRVHQYRRTMRALDASTLTLDLAARALLYLHPEAAASQPGLAPSAITVVFGSDRGLCGAFNDRMARFTGQELAGRGVEGVSVRVVAIGRRVARRLRRAGRAPDALLSAPSSLEAIEAAVADLLDFLDADRRAGRESRVRLVYARPIGSTRFEPCSEQVLPVDTGWMRQLSGLPWVTRKLPMELSDPLELLRGLIRHRMALAIVKAFGSSLAAENAARLAAMEAASHNVAERLASLRARHQTARQAAITAELLDIQSAAAALEEPDADPEDAG
ncbi:MAG: F0F1 ATP synthase subunit gamma [Burkholderiaceae bacterium]|nr:F0F1 ATP synthase subunit gamma [Burkholderiaceae bacterium]